MIFIIIVFFTLLFVLSLKEIDDVISKIIAIFFLSYWGISLILSVIGVFDFFKVHSQTYFIMLLAVASFIVGMTLEKRAIPTFPYVKKINCDFSLLVRNNFFLVIQLCLIFYLSKYASIAMSIAEVSGKGAMQGDEVASVLRNIPYFTFMYAILGNIVFNITCPLLMFMFLKFQKKYILRIIIAICFIALFAVINGGRSLVVILILYLIITYVCINEKIKFNVTKQKLFILLCSIAFILVGISFMTHYRNKGDFNIQSEDFTESIYESGEKIGSYSTLTFVMFNHAMQEDYLEMFGGYQFGRATFAGLDIYITGVLKTFGFDLTSTNVKIIHYLQDTWVPTSSKTKANYAYTGVLLHYLDFGLFGVFFFPLLFGFLIRKIAYEFEKTGNLFVFFILSFSFFMAVHSVFTCYFIKSWVFWHLAVLGLGIIISIKKRV